jgi:hypothetical protein
MELAICSCSRVQSLHIRFINIYLFEFIKLFFRIASSYRPCNDGEYFKVDTDSNRVALVFLQEPCHCNG